MVTIDSLTRNILLKLRMRKKANLLIPAVLIVLLMYYFFSLKSPNDLESAIHLASPQSNTIRIDDTLGADSIKHSQSSAGDILKQNEGLLKPAIPGVGTSFNSLLGESAVDTKPLESLNSDDTKKKIGADEDVYKDFKDGKGTSFNDVSAGLKIKEKPAASSKEDSYSLDEDMIPFKKEKPEDKSQNSNSKLSHKGKDAGTYSVDQESPSLKLSDEIPNKEKDKPKKLDLTEDINNLPFLKDDQAKTDDTTKKLDSKMGLSSDSFSSDHKGLYNSDEDAKLGSTANGNSKPLHDSTEDAKLKDSIVKAPTDDSLYNSDEDSKLNPGLNTGSSDSMKGGLYDSSEDAKLATAVYEVKDTTDDLFNSLEDSKLLPTDSVSDDLFNSKEDAKLSPGLKEKEKTAKASSSESNGGLSLIHETFYKIFEILTKGKPSVPKLDNYGREEKIFHPGWDAVDEPVMSKEYLSSFLQVSPADVESMHKSHSYVVDNLPDSPPEGLYKNSGVVYVGGGKFNWLALMSIRTLRALGSKLPVEVLIPKPEEYEKNICEKIFPSLNAKCISLDKLIDERTSKEHTFKGYQYKFRTI
ncbi:unnamed protein product [Ambrosiozyma monospora]|uniref:Unnamed protein product n=1 Tax=Ambrosiozyma monospora TaxID=43982 RepID=A0A9W6Z566_AMBMO|nr:unnamed protein product [Ambrosiozyma monospora]